jgi:threonine synthase
MPTVRCTRCAFLYPPDETPFLCPRCEGIFDYDGPPVFDARQIDGSQPGIWRYLRAFDLPSNAPVVSLGEGNTPLIPVSYENQQVWFKLESVNPTGSYKDRGSALLLSQLAARGVRQAVEDSSGNAGASFAAYAARAGIGARVFVPESASGPKRGQIVAYGAELAPVPGLRSAAAEAVLSEARGGAVYASHAYLPFGLAGIATIAYEVWDQLGAAPGSVVAPVGHGGLLLGMMRGFAALQQAGQIGKQPYYVGVQARACAPLWLGWAHGMEAMTGAEEGLTVAEGVRVRHPLRAAPILQVLADRTAGRMHAVKEEDILPAYRDMARLGVHVEPTSALVWAALRDLWGKIPEPIVLILSGAGLKYNPTIS